MPLNRQQYLQPEGELGLWEIEENEAYFLDRMNLSDEESAHLKKIKGGPRRLEWLAGRWLLHQMSGREVRGYSYKDEHGKPFLSDSFYEISISHSGKFAAVIAAPRGVGIDIQRLVESIERLAHKYMREAEMASLETATRLEHLHVYWGAKEALYKAYGKRQLDFKEHIHIEPFSFDLNNGECYGVVSKGDFYCNYLLKYEQIEDYILVYCLEDIGDQRMV